MSPNRDICPSIQPVPSLLQSLQSWLESPRAASFGGRFVSVAIAHLSRFDPALAATLLRLAAYDGESRGKAWRLDTEFEFQRRGRQRRADIAIFDGELSKTPTCLVEIKYDDQGSDRNSAQLKDYLGYCKSNPGTAFLCLTQYSMRTQTSSPIYRECLFSKFADELDGRNERFTPSALLIDYLRDKGLVMDAIDLDALGRLMNRLFNPRHGAGRQQKNRYMTKDIPAVFQTTMTNVNVFGSEISRNLRIRRVPVIDFEIVPWIVPRRVIKARRHEQQERLEKMLGKPTRVDAKAKAGGILYAFAQSYLRGGARRRGTMGIDYGYYFEIDPGKTTQCYLYGAVWGDGIAHNPKLGEGRFQSERRVGKRTLFSRSECISILRGHLERAAREANRKKKTARATKQVLRRLIRSL
jgi:hypothetical protein